MASKHFRTDTHVSNLAGTVRNIAGVPRTTLTEPTEHIVGAVTYDGNKERIWVNVGGTAHTWRYISLT